MSSALYDENDVQIAVDKPAGSAAATMTSRFRTGKTNYTSAQTKSIPEATTMHKPTVRVYDTLLLWYQWRRVINARARARTSVRLFRRFRGRDRNDTRTEVAKTDRIPSRASAGELKTNSPRIEDEGGNIFFKTRARASRPFVLVVRVTWKVKTLARLYCRG